MSDLIARLETAAPAAAPGDWSDVVARSERLRHQTVRTRIVIALAIALLAVPAIAVATHYFDVLSLTATEEEVPLPRGETTLGYVLGDRVQLPGRPPAKLAAALLAPFVPPYGQLVVPTADRTRVVYQTWEGPLVSRRRAPRGTPVLRFFDARTGADIVLARGAHSPAVRADGTIAYTQALVPRWSPRNRSGGLKGNLVVRRGPRAPAVRWSTFATTWSNLAWAGSYLLARAELRKPFEGGGFTNTYQLHAFSGPKRSRRLPLGSLIAISPDGRYAFGGASEYGGQASDSVLRLVQIASGRIVDDIVVDGGPGTWTGDTIILTTGLAPEPLPPTPEGLRILPGADHIDVIVLRASGGKLAVERELRLSREVIERTGVKASEFYFGFEAPAFVDEAGRQFTAKLVIHNTLRNRQIETIVFYLTCDRLEVRCRRGRSLDPRQIRWSALAVNPSRPLPD